MVKEFDWKLCFLEEAAIEAHNRKNSVVFILFLLLHDWRQEKYHYMVMVLPFNTASQKLSCHFPFQIQKCVFL